jgi:hypothetical protein
MKSLKDFISYQTKELPKMVENSFVDEEYEATDEPPYELIENPEHHQNHQHSAVPPAVLIMRRKAVRQYPGGKYVALYYIDKLDKYVTIPYDSMQWNAQAEEFGVIEHLKQIIKENTAQTVMFEDGKVMKVSVDIADNVLKVYSVLNEENKQKVSEMAQSSKLQFSKVINFAQEYLK